MKLIATTEKRLNELFELALQRIKPSNEQSVGATVPWRTVVYHVELLKAEIRDGGL